MGEGSPGIHLRDPGQVPRLGILGGLHGHKIDPQAGVIELNSAGKAGQAGTDPPQVPFTDRCRGAPRSPGCTKADLDSDEPAIRVERDEVDLALG